MPDTTPQLPNTTFTPLPIGTQQLPACIDGWECYPIANNPTAITEARRKGVHITVKDEGILLYDEDFEADDKGRLLYRDCILGVRKTADRLAEDRYLARKAKDELDEVQGTLTQQEVAAGG